MLFSIGDSHLTYILNHAAASESRLLLIAVIVAVWSRTSLAGIGGSNEWSPAASYQAFACQDAAQELSSQNFFPMPKFEMIYRWGGSLEDAAKEALEVF